MKYSIVLLDYDPEDRLLSMRNECKERIHRFSAGRDYELIPATEKGIQKAANLALAKTTGDYIIFMGNDVMIDDPNWLEKLCSEDAITSWKWTTFHLTQEPELEFSCVGMPRSLYEKVGGFDEQFSDGYGYDDNDFLLRAKEAGYKHRVERVKLDHGESRTFKSYFNDVQRRKLTEKNLNLFKEKWKEHPNIKKFL